MSIPYNYLYSIKKYKQKEYTIRLDLQQQQIIFIKLSIKQIFQGLICRNNQTDILLFRKLTIMWATQQYFNFFFFLIKNFNKLYSYEAN